MHICCPKKQRKVNAHVILKTNPTQSPCQESADDSELRSSIPYTSVNPTPLKKLVSVSETGTDTCDYI